MTWHSLLSPDSFGWVVLDFAVKATALIVLAAGLVLVFGRSSAALRHRIWALLFTALLLGPFLGAVLPRWGWPVIPRGWEAATRPVAAAWANRVPQSVPAVAVDAAKASATTSTATTLAGPNPRNEVQPMPAAGQAGEDRIASLPAPEFPDSVSQIPETETPSVRTLTADSVPWLAVVWMGGALLTLLPLVVGILANTRLRWHTFALVGSEWDALLGRLRRQLDLRRQVRLLLAGPRQMPMTFGMWRPCVVLPADAVKWSAERREIVLLHELAHIARRDVPLQMVARLACAVYWFHPLAWWALRRMRLEREHACDDHVLRAGQAAPEYAAQLLEIARAHNGRSVLLNAALSMARPSQLEGRLLAVLDENRSRRALGTISSGGLAAITLAIVLVLATVRPTLQAKSPEAENASSIVAKADNSQPGRTLVLTGIVTAPDGKPAAAATVEAIANDRQDGWRRRPPGDPGIDHYETKTDATGHFVLRLPRDISRPRQFLSVLASDQSHRVASAHVDPRLTSTKLELKLQEVRTVRIRFLDTAGNPISGIEPWLNYIELQTGTYLESMYHPVWHSMAAGWPRFTRSDDKGFASVVVPVASKTLFLAVDDEHVGAHTLQVDVAKEPATVALKSPRFLNGRVIDADNQPVAGAEIVIMEEPYHGVRTKADGTFRLSSGSTVRTMFPNGESIIHVYPPADSSSLFKAIEWKWPNDGLGDADLVVHLKRGQIVEGHVVEKGSGKPVVGANIRFDPQEYHNRFFTQSAKSRMAGSDMKYMTDSQGHFRLPVLPGPGYLLVAAPTLDYVHQTISMGDRYYGKEGLEREYYDGAVKLRLTQGEHPEPLKIELERGVTLRCKVVQPDGKAVDGHAYARSYLQFKNDASQWLPDVPIEEGVLEIPGFDAAHTNPVFVLDRADKFGAALALTGTESESRPIVLQPCGQARFRFIDEAGKPLANYEPWVEIIVTPGVAATHHIEPNRPLWVDALIWANVSKARRDQRPKTDADGRVTVAGLIPGATYRLMYTDKKGWTDGHEFQIRGGETTDVGEVVLSRRR